MFKSRPRAIVFILALFLALSLRADTIVLNDGTKLEGEIVDETNDSVTLKLKLGTAVYKKSEIRDIRKSPALAPEAAELRDVLKLKNGDTLKGLLVSDDGKEIVFDLIVSGKTVSKTMLSRTTFKRAEVEELKAITDAQRTAARKYMEIAEAQTARDAVAEKEVAIEVVMLPGLNPGNRVQGKQIEYEHFKIVSNTEDDFLRRAAFRLNKVFNAYKQYFGVERNQAQKVTIVIYGSMANYHADVGDIKNPAFYAPDDKMICAGCEVSLLETVIANERQNSKYLAVEIDEWRRRAANKRAEIQAAVSKAYGKQHATTKSPTAVGQAEMEQMKAEQRERQLELAVQEKKINELQSKIDAMNKHNDQLFEQYTQEMFATLYHEGFHAFLDNFLLPEGMSRVVPRWLNEGLAQYFELSRLEAGSLILGQDSRERMAILRKFHSEMSLIPLDKFVNGGQEDYVVHDIRTLEHSTKNYMQAWLVANILGEKGRLKKEILEAYVKLLKDNKPPLEALPTLTGMTNAELQAAIEEKLKPGFKK